MAGREIRFHRANGAYGAFSNFAPYPVAISGKRWPTSEHYFQAQKFAGTELEEKIRAARSAAIAARMGRDRGQRLRSDWEAAEESVTLVALRAKFRQHPCLASLLRSTAGARLVEHSRSDRYWGDGGDGSGRNRLGALLMRVRDELLGRAGSDEPEPRGRARRRRRCGREPAEAGASLRSPDRPSR